MIESEDKSEDEMEQLKIFKASTDDNMGWRVRRLDGSPNLLSIKVANQKFPLCSLSVMGTFSGQRTRQTMKNYKIKILKIYPTS